ncbi:MAG: dipicolinate synthase subunit B [Defluviitaleaceae bacterium]|nr:dipicolinate synthase subunit B [Defluviitaleaceae bacterium]MCL2262458.1 dipicolinate synthase subunit B [Defluviitaleaceae bacterium]
MKLEGKKIGFGITGSYCTILEIIEPLKKLKAQGADIFPVVSENVFEHSSRFHDKDTFLKTLEEITGNKPISTINEAETFGPDNPMDTMIIAPATGNTIAKLANGISDGPVLLATKATLRNGSPVLLALFSNDALGMNGMNITKLYNTKNFFFVPFGQDNPTKKPASMTADLSLLEEALAHALEGRQIQPSIIAHK